MDIGAFESQGFTLTVVGDHVQDTVIDSAFASPLTVQVTTNNPAEPVNGGEITFLAPASGASAILNGNPVGIQGGQASVTATANGTAGSYTVWATAAAAAGVPLSLTNVRAATTTAVSASAGPGLPGHAMTFTASVSGRVPGLPLRGTVDFFDSTTGTDLGRVALVNGKAALTTRTLSVGGHTITATYSGNADYLRSPGTTAVTVLAPSSLAGAVFVDFNDDGLADFGEAGIRDVTITLTGTDDLGRPVRLAQPTNAHGGYVFNNLRPGSYQLTERQPAGYLQGDDTVGTAGGSVVATDRFSIQLGQGVSGMNYNYGELPAATAPVHASQSASIAFWNGPSGQALINSFNGGLTSTELASWLAATLPNMYGSNAGSKNLTGKSNADVAALFQQDFQAPGVQLDAQVLATALNVYATNATLDASSLAGHDGFTITKYGLGTDAAPVGSSGAAFGVANNTTRTVMDMLLATDARATDGVLYGGNVTQQTEANRVYAAVNQAR